MVEAGHTVEMITSHNSTTYLNVNIEGINVHCLPITYDNKFSSFRRIIAFLLFLWKATFLSFKIKKDIIYATSTPLTVGGIALINKWFLKTPYIFEVRDLWPQVPIEMGIIKNRLFIWLLRKFEKLIYGNSKSIIALSPEIEHSIKSNCGYVPVFMIPNFSDIDYFKSDEKPLNEKIVISYIGTIGIANGLEKMIELAKVANQSFYDKFQFEIMGDGSRKEYLQELVDGYGLKNVVFKAFSNKEDVKKLMIHSDLIYVSFADYPILGNTTSPNKFFDAIAMGKVVILNFEGWLTEIVVQREIGYKQTALNLNELLIQILNDKLDFDLWLSKQNDCLALSIESFDKNLIVQKVLKLIQY